MFKKPNTAPTPDTPMNVRDAFYQFARNDRWGTCGDCPRDVYRRAYPEFCVYTDRYDHKLDVDGLTGLWKNHRDKVESARMGAVTVHSDEVDYSMFENKHTAGGVGRK